MSDTNFSAIGELVIEGKNLLDSVKGGAIQLMQTQFDSLMGTSTQSIDNFLTEKRAEFSGVLANTDTKAFPYINLFKNAFARQTDSNGDLIFPITTGGFAELEEVLPFNSENVPQAVRTAYQQFFPDNHWNNPNIIHVRFAEGITPNYWLPVNPVDGNYSLGFVMAYVVRGSMGSIAAGQSGGFMQYTSRHVWHIDGQFNASAGLDAYLAMPFVVGGYCPDASLVSSIPVSAKKLTLNVG